MRLLARLVPLASAALLSACASASNPTATSASATGAGTKVQPAVGWSETRTRSAAAERGSYRGDFSHYPAAAELKDRLVREHGFDRGELERIFSRIERQQWILDFMNKPTARPSTTPTGAWDRYRAKFVTDANIASGLRFWRQYDAVLDRASARYGVPPEYIVAIIGVETRWGSYMGKHRVIDALATIAFDYPRRAEYFTGELESFLIMTRNEGLDPFRPVGSYAGAMGLGQFMPSSFLRYAVDFDGDGRRDLWNPVDAIGSVANYFAGHGWRTGEAVTVRAQASGSGAQAMKTGFDTRYSPADLRRAGINAASTGGADEVSLIRLDAKGGYQYWLGLPNFYVITRYNHSSYYAMAVHQLAQELRTRRGLPGPVVTQRVEGAGEPPL
ncbi:MAG: lytic murein transglycosylase B [Chromatiaceae bacterium]|jgi:membrane-bound lytic murein transglycosylase B|nr:lytic murein transglycosylase B [Chromatiaceae bacterium]